MIQKIREIVPPDPFALFGTVARLGRMQSHPLRQSENVLGLLQMCMILKNLGLSANVHDSRPIVLI